MNATSRRNLFAALPAGATAVALGVSQSAQGQGANSVQSLTAVINNFVPGVGGFVGTLNLSQGQVQVVNGVLSAIGSISGNVLGPTGSVIGTITTQAITVPLQVTGSCTILTLTLGPLDLNLLGLVIHLNQIVLNITAIPGAGNLLGNLLCAVANLLNSGGPLSNLLNSLAGLLQQILNAL